MIIAVGLAVGFRGNVWNIGAEGQLTIGAICGGGLALAFPDTESALLLPAIVVAAVLGGMAWAAIPALLKTRFNANEILTSLMLSYVAIELLGYFVRGPWRDPGGYNFPESSLFTDAALMPIIVTGTRVHLGLVLALLAVVSVWVLMSRTMTGFRIKVAGMAAGAAEYSGINRNRQIWFCLLLAGALAGIAGVGEVAGPIGQLLPVISPGYGFAAIIVAFLGRLNPLGIVLSSLLMALLYLGGETVQIDLGVPRAVTGVFQGMLLFYLLASDVLINYRIQWRPAPEQR
jgi:simple sugar transport system permease protein